MNNVDPAVAVLEWFSSFYNIRWWPMCDCLYNFKTGKSRPNCTVTSFINLLRGDHIHISKSVEFIRYKEDQKRKMV
ncbi:hypothetical protein HZS_3955 [Henneguya salminicola]|nr:hypothetical protein HZS_3955 [Henneguya salminicola]